jgi:uncharacterized protein YjbI with pentapeptide repeats
MGRQESRAMANPEHLAKLKEGVKAWNDWRKKNPILRPDLSDTDLNDAHLSGVHLTDVNLYSSRLSSANLSHAVLVHADLNGADLTRANLSDALLIDADLADADLRDTSFVEAALHSTKFSRTYLNHADLSRARLVGTIFANVDLSAAKGLEDIDHRSPSTIGIDTIYLSQGKIPEVFLRGVGVPDQFITYARSLVANPIEFYSCFISYSSNDSDFATELHTKLQASNVRCWFAPEDLKIGDPFQERIEESIRLHDKLLVVLSENSVNSAWVEREVNAAIEKEQRQGKTVLFPIRVDDCVMETTKPWAADLRRTRHIGDFRNWKDHDSFKKAFDRLLRDLKSSESKTKI